MMNIMYRELLLLVNIFHILWTNKAKSLNQKNSTFDGIRDFKYNKNIKFNIKIIYIFIRNW